MIRIFEILLKTILAAIAYSLLHNSSPEHAIALAIAILTS